MAKIDPAIYFDASFGGVALLIQSLDTASGRDIAIQSPARGDDHALQDRGRKLLETNASILFCDQPNQESYTARFDRVRAMADAGDPQIFSHPLLGSFRARIADFSIRANADEGSIEVQARILAEKEPQSVFPAGGGVTGDAGLEAVSAASKTADTKLAAAGLSSSAPSLCLAAVTAWSTTDALDTNAVLAQVATLTGAISTAIDDLDLATDLARWPAYQAMMALSFQLARAGETFTAAAARMFDLVVTRDQPVRAICARVYGPALAEDRTQQITKINRLRTPGRVRAGTRLKMLSEGANP